MSWDMYWQPASEEHPRTTRVRAGVRKYVKNLKNVLFMVIKSFNDNIVIYEYDDQTNTVNSSWLSIDAEDIERHTKNNNPSLRSELNPAEEILFGSTLKSIDGRCFLKLRQEQLSTRIFELVMDSAGNPAVISTINNVQCRVEHAYVQMKKGPVPDVEYMKLYGRSMIDGSQTVETLFN